MSSKKLTSKDASDIQLKKMAEETAKAVKNAAKIIREVTSSTRSRRTNYTNYSA